LLSEEAWKIVHQLREARAKRCCTDFYGRMLNGKELKVEEILKKEIIK
jgi:hypothetical protein